jgi:hypothetical protein
MSGNCWRLLAAFLLILVAALVHGQDGAADHAPLLTPNFAPNIAPNLGLLRYAPLSDPVWIPSPASPERYPVGRYPFGSGPVVFPQIVQAAGIIFSGHVTSVARAPSSRGPVSTAVTFKVEHAMRGTSAGRDLTIHEWAGLWTRGERYRVGERVLLFLYSPSKLGLTSPVAGPIGRFAVNSGGEIVMTPQHVHILATDPILRGRTVAPYSDFAGAVRRSSREE